MEIQEKKGKQRRRTGQMYRKKKEKEKVNTAENKEKIFFFSC